jgi:hypothetical protein
MTAITARELELQKPDAKKLLSDEPEMESSLHYMQLLFKAEVQFNRAEEAEAQLQELKQKINSLGIFIE